MRSTISLLLAAYLISPGSGLAQDSRTGSLAGSAEDPDGSPLSGVEITVEGSSLPEPLIVETDERGRFQVKDLEPGFYKVAAERIGYVTVTQEGIPIQAGREFELEITMNPVPTSP